MSDYRKQSGDFVRGASQRWRSHSRKLPTCTWQPTVPSWEKKFVSSVGCILWKKFLDNKKYTDLYINVLQWDDYAVEEAFNDAKERFWSKIDGLACDISLPDPDMYIDEVDWNAEVDKDLIMDLEREPNISDKEVQQLTKVHRVGELLDLDVPVPCTGWGDPEDVPSTGGANAEAAPCTGWGEYDQNVVNNGYPWQWGNKNVESSRWQNGWNNSWQWNHEGRFNNGENAVLEAGPSWYTPGYEGGFMVRTTKLIWGGVQEGRGEEVMPLGDSIFRALKVDLVQCG